MLFTMQLIGRVGVRDELVKRRALSARQCRRRVAVLLSVPLGASESRAEFFNEFRGGPYE